MSKPLWTAQDAAKATGGKAVGEWTISGLSIDTRTIEAGDLFVPLRDVRDGHEFIPMAREKNAGAVMSEHDMDAPALVVKDSLGALTALGKAACARSSALRIGVTGSVGKTSVKEALAHMFAGFGQTHKSLASYNNHWGVPLTMARMPEETNYGVFELGMNHAGEMSVLSKMLKPQIALITTVAGAHLAHFENVEAIAHAKAEIIDGLSEGGTLILNGENKYTDLIKSIAKTAGVSADNILTFGHADNDDVSIVDVREHPQVTNIRLRIGGQQIDVTTPLIGDHWVENLAACMAVALAAKLDLRKAARRFRTMSAIAGRGETHQLNFDGKSVTLIDESYNANPTSMRAAISVLARVEGRKIAVLGDMFELGADELKFHAELSEPLEKAGVARVIVTGECMRALRGALPQTMRAAWCSNRDAVKDALLYELQDGDTVLIKGSNATGLGIVAKALIKEGTS
jgi:UDP-N-acetylmuramoyl-tripeptide--D-alanyl-D-alanine ligase